MSGKRKENPFPSVWHPVLQPKFALFVAPICLASRPIHWWLLFAWPPSDFLLDPICLAFAWFPVGPHLLGLILIRWWLLFAWDPSDSFVAPFCLAFSAKISYFRVYLDFWRHQYIAKLLIANQSKLRPSVRRMGTAGWISCNGGNSIVCPDLDIPVQIGLI